LHPSGVFRRTDHDALEALVSQTGFGVIFAPGSSGLFAAHAPVLLAQGTLRFHLSSANPLCAVMVQHGSALVVVTGPHAYISPDWYGAADQVPTWNYLSAEIEGPLEALRPDETVALLDELAAHFEAALAPKPSWSRSKMAPGRFEAMVSAITGFRMRIERLEGVVKLSQNKSADQVERAAAQLAKRPDTGALAIATLMRSAVRASTAASDD